MSEAQKEKRVRKLRHGDKVMTLTVEGDTAKTTMQKDETQNRVSGSMTYLYDRARAILQSLADRRNKPITQQFGTVHPKMKAWLRHKGVQEGFEITEDETDGRTVKARRTFRPRHDQ